MKTTVRVLNFGAWPLAAALLVIAGGCSRSAQVASAPPGVPVQVALATKEDVPSRIESIGNVQPLRTVSVKSQVDGVIAEVHFQEGQDVKAGDLLVMLDRRPFENSLRSARADLATARANAEQAQADLDRNRRLDEQAAISKESFVDYVTKAATAAAQVQAREAAVANAELQLGYTEIRAPISGRTGQRLLHEGALVKANDINFTIVTINELSPIAISYSAPEGTLDEIRAALASGVATVTAVDRATGISRENGRLTFIDNTVDPTTGMITLKAVFPNEDRALWPGRFVYVVTSVGLDKGAIVVPSTAVQNSQTGSTVYVVKPDHTVELRNVKVARTAGDNTLLLAGIDAGDTVVTDGQLRLLPGMKAEVRQTSGAPIAGHGADPVPTKS